MRRIAVHHFVANLTTRQYGPHPMSDLLGVDYILEVPPDTEFPRWLPRMDVFARFYLSSGTASGVHDPNTVGRYPGRRQRPP